MRYRAIHASVGFMGRYWEEGQITDDIQEEELLQKPELEAHFEPIDVLKPNAVSGTSGDQFMSQITGQVTDLNRKTVAELKLIAAQNGIDFPADAKKADIIKILTEQE